MSDSDIRELLPDYVRGKLDPPTLARIEAAMHDNAALSAECEQLRQYYAAIDEIEPVKAPAGFLHRVNERIDRPSAMERIVKAVLLPLQVKLPLEIAGVAAAALLLIVVLRPAEQKLMTRQIAAPEMVMAPPPPAAKADLREAVDGLASSMPAKKAADSSVRGSVKGDAARSNADDRMKALDHERRLAKSEQAPVIAAEDAASERPTMGSDATPRVSRAVETPATTAPSSPVATSGSPSMSAGAAPAKFSASTMPVATPAQESAVLDIGTLTLAMAEPSDETEKKIRLTPATATAKEKSIARSRRSLALDESAASSSDKLALLSQPIGDVSDSATHSALEVRIRANHGEFTIDTRNGHATYTITMPADRYAQFRRSLNTRWKVTDRTTVTTGLPGGRVKFTVVVLWQQ